MKNENSTGERASMRSFFDDFDSGDPFEAAETTRVKESTKRKTFDISCLSVAELLDLRDEVEKKLPPLKLQQLDLAKELIVQFYKIKELQQAVLMDTELEPNKQAVVIKACTDALQQIVKLQQDLYNAERFKALENYMIESVRALPLDVATAFMRNYEALESPNE